MSKIPPASDHEPKQILHNTTVLVDKQNSTAITDKLIKRNRTAS